MTPQDLQGKLDAAQRGPSLVKPPREIGKPLDDYRGLRIVPLIDRITSVKAHIGAMSTAEIMQMAREIRHGLRLRMVNDAVLAALLKNWSDRATDQRASPSRSDREVLEVHPMTASEVQSRQHEDAQTIHMRLCEPSPATTLATPLLVGRGEVPTESRKSPAASDK